MAAAARWISGETVIDAQVKKWRFATPRAVWPDACWVHETGSLGLAGDAFAGPKVEGAALSGLSVAERLGLAGDAGQQR
jgi:renalase